MELAEAAAEDDGVKISCFAPCRPPNGANTKKARELVLHFVEKAVAVLIELR